MATVLPPPTKRQKREVVENARQQQAIQEIPNHLGSVRVQFVDHATGSSATPAVSIPVADTSIKNLEILLNTLQGNVGRQKTVDNLQSRNVRAKRFLFCTARRPSADSV
jgi:ribosome assembly protein 4